MSAAGVASHAGFRFPPPIPSESSYLSPACTTQQAVCPRPVCAGLQFSYPPPVSTAYTSAAQRLSQPSGYSQTFALSASASAWGSTPPPFHPFDTDPEDSDTGPETLDPFVDTSGNPIKWKEYRRMLEFIMSFYPQVKGSSNPGMDQRAFFEKIFNPRPQPNSSLPS